MRHKNNFDLLRLIAAVIVILRHSFGLSGNNDPLEIWTNGSMHLGQLGVSVFFVISGYLITLSLLRSDSFFSYLKKRFLRIFPGLIICVLITIFILGPLTSQLEIGIYFSHSDTWSYLWNISLYKLQYSLPGVFVNNIYGSAVNGSLWTLAYEFSFYILLMFFSIVGILRLRYVFIGCAAALFCAIYIGENLYIYNYSSNYLLGLNIVKFHEFFLYFFIGSAFYFVRDRIKYLGAITLILLLTYLTMIYFNTIYAQFINYLLIPSCIFFLAFKKGKTNSVGKIGDFSYGLYIYSFPIQQLIIFLYPEISLEVFFIISVLSVAPFAIASWKLVEKPAMSLKSQ